MTMFVRSTLALFLILILFLDTLNGIHPGYFRQHEREEQLTNLIDNIDKRFDDSNVNFDSSEIDDDEDQLIKRNKYPNFHVSPLWLSRRTRTNRMFGKPLWISRTG